MITWVLILFAHVGTMGSGNSNALLAVPGFSSLEQCGEAGKKSERLASGTVKEVRWVCVQQSAPQYRIEATPVSRP